MRGGGTPTFAEASEGHCPPGTLAFGRRTDQVEPGACGCTDWDLVSALVVLRLGILPFGPRLPHVGTALLPPKIACPLHGRLSPEPALASVT